MSSEPSISSKALVTVVSQNLFQLVSEVFLEMAEPGFANVVKSERHLRSKNRKRVGIQVHRETANEAAAAATTSKQKPKRFRLLLPTIKSVQLQHHRKLPGGHRLLSDEEETEVIRQLVALSDATFPVSFYDLRCLVKAYLDRAGRVVQKFHHQGVLNLPGVKWSTSFVRRHHLSLAKRLASGIRRQRSAVRAVVVDTFFDFYKKQIAGVPPDNIWTFVEINLSDNPGAKNVVTRREAKNIRLMPNHPKSAVSIVECGSAGGRSLPPFVIYRAADGQVEPWWTQGYHSSSKYYAATASGWLDMRTFDSWFWSILYPILKNQQGAKVVVGDYFSAHVSGHVLNLCKTGNIRLMTLPPNSEEVIQPFRFSYSETYATTWRRLLTEWKRTDEGERLGTLPKSRFPSLLRRLKQEVGKAASASGWRSGFEASGLYPANPTKVKTRMSGGRGASSITPSEELQESVAVAKTSEPSVKISIKRKWQDDSSSSSTGEDPAEDNAADSAGTESSSEEET